MARKKKDDDDQGVSILDFVVPQKVDAFVEAYSATDIEGEMTEVFTDSRLREFFKAWPCSLGDPLAAYLDMLAQHDFRMRVTVTGEPAVLAVLRE